MDKNWMLANIKEYEDFESFVLGWLNKENIWKYYHFYPQYYFFCDYHKKISLDFFAFLENLDNDINTIVKRINRDLSLQKSNTSQHKKYREYYSPRTIDIVSSVYADDIKMLGYSFDNSSLEKQVYDRDIAKCFPY